MIGFKEDVALPRSVLVLELLRMPSMRLHEPQTREVDDYRRWHALTQEEKENISARQLAVLEATEERLSFAQVCQLAGCEFNQNTRELLKAHIDAGRVRMCGHSKTALYWARRPR